MKKYLIPALALLLFSCQKEAETEQPLPETTAPAKHTLTIHASFGDEATKTLFSLDGEGKYHTAWEVGDVIAIREHVVADSSDPDLDDYDDYSSWTESDALTVGGETADFTVSFDPYWWESTYSKLTDEQKATYTFSYSYLATTMPRYMIYTSSDEKGEYIPFMMPIIQTVYASGFSAEDDLLVSKTTASSATRPSEISFNFARLGTIVEITLSGLEEGDIVKSGSWYTGDTFVPGVSMESCIAYYPDLQEYVKLVDMLGEMSGPVFEHQINFNAENTPAIVADAEGKAKIYLRCLPGRIDDWFGLLCTVDRGGSEVVLSKEVSLSDLGRSLEFKDGGLTKFSVAMLPAQASNPAAITYVVPKPRDGFMAAWPAGEHVSGYKCYYQRRGGYDYDLGEELFYDEIPLTPVAGTGEMDGMYYVEVAGGLAADEYYLYVKAIPDGESGPTSFDYASKTLYVNSEIEFTWPDPDDYSPKAELTKLSDVLWRVTEIEDTFNPWYFDVSNLRTAWGQLWSTDETTPWTLQTKTDPTFQHQGEIAHIVVKMSNTKTNTLIVKGITSDGTETTIAMPEKETWSESEDFYEYDFSGGEYNGFRIDSGSYIWVTMLRVYYYAPTGD